MAKERLEAVSIHVPARGTTTKATACENGEIEFQSTFPHGERLSLVIEYDFTYGFNPRSRTGNDRMYILLTILSEVSIHVPARGTTSSLYVFRVKDNGFNPRSRTGNDPNHCRWCVVPHKVSIHVPARGTTMDAYMTRYPIFVSIHVPARGTTTPDCSEWDADMVSIHVPARGTTTLRSNDFYVFRVSIHVPARGTTRVATMNDNITTVSIHVPARGTTLFLIQQHRYSGCFNPRSRTGNDISSNLRFCHKHGFNPRSRTGNDFGSRFGTSASDCVSIHVPARGTTQSVLSALLPVLEFQSTFPHGERRHGQLVWRICLYVSIHVPARGTTGERTDDEALAFIVSIHVPARGTTLTLLAMAEALGRMFQSTFPHGERLICYSPNYFDEQVSIHVPARGTTETILPERHVFMGFNPRSRTGNDQSVLSALLPVLEFQSTFPHGERRSCDVSPSGFWRFQSTFPHGERREDMLYL